MRELLGNIEDLKDYHKKVILPKLEHACTDPCKMRYVLGPIIYIIMFAKSSL